MAFVTFEGIDGSGKSTLISALEAELKSRGKVVKTTLEPGGSELGQELRSILLRTKGEVPVPIAELLIYEADRAQHVATKIKPWLEEHFWVLSDRFTDSSLIFQGVGRGVGTSEIKWLNSFATQGLVPDLTILLDCPVEVGSRRRSLREPDRFELEKLPFHQAIRDGFLKLAKSEPKRFLILDSSVSKEILLEKTLQELQLRKLL